MDKEEWMLLRPYISDKFNYEKSCMHDLWLAQGFNPRLVTNNISPALARNHHLEPRRFASKMETDNIWFISVVISIFQPFVRHERWRNCVSLTSTSLIVTGFEVLGGILNERIKNLK